VTEKRGPVELRILLPADLAAAAEERARLAGISVEMLVAIAVELEVGSGRQRSPPARQVEPSEGRP